MVNLIFLDCLTLEDGKLSCAETSVINNLRCVTSQKGEDLVHTATDTSNHAVFIFDDIWQRQAGVLNQVGSGSLFRVNGNDQIYQNTARGREMFRW